MFNFLATVAFSVSTLLSGSASGDEAQDVVAEQLGLVDRAEAEDMARAVYFGSEGVESSELAFNDELGAPTWVVSGEGAQLTIDARDGAVVEVEF